MRKSLRIAKVAGLSLLLLGIALGATSPGDHHSVGGNGSSDGSLAVAASDALGDWERVPNDTTAAPAEKTQSAPKVVDTAATASGPITQGSKGSPEFHPDRPDIKIFRWGEIMAGNCHQLGATLEIRSNGTATFTSRLWTHSAGTDYWHSTVVLRERQGELDRSPRVTSPAIGHPKDGPKHQIDFNYDFDFLASDFRSITEAVEHSEC